MALFTHTRDLKINIRCNNKIFIILKHDTSISYIFRFGTIIHKWINESNPNQPVILKIFTLTDRGCRPFYDFIVRNIKVSKASRKWEREININFIEWRKIYTLPFKIPKDSNFLWFQYKINHRIL